MGVVASLKSNSATRGRRAGMVSSSESHCERNRVFWRFALKLAALACAAGILAASAWYGASRPAGSFDEVQGGVLYRSGQPTEAFWPILARQYRIRTVISLRANRPDADWWRREQDACRCLGIKIIHIPLEGRADLTPTPEEWDAFSRAVTDPADWPILVHGDQDAGSTDVMVGGYRVAVQGWSMNRTLKDAAAHSFPPERHPECVGFWQQLKDNRNGSVVLD